MNRDIQALGKSMELARDIAAFHAQRLEQGMTLAHEISKFAQFKEVAGKIPGDWGKQASQLVEAAQKQLIAPPAGQDRTVDTLLNGAGAAVGTQAGLLKGLYQTEWDQHVQPIIDRQAAESCGRFNRLESRTSLLSGTSTITTA